MDIPELVELLFFDTFAHDNTEELNLDLVQFPKPVYVTEVRIIPLGARVQADFPGGVRLGATNPSQFKIEFFVNDLGKPGASTFESLGGFEYNQNGCINLDCIPSELIRKIPTDGLVLRGWYTTITLAVYGTLTKNITEQIIQPVVNPTLPAQPSVLPEPTQIITTNALESEWTPENITVPIEYSQPTAAYQQAYPQPEPYPQEYQEYYNDVPKDPRNYHHPPEAPEWDNKIRTRSSDVERDRDRDRIRDLPYQKPGNLERDHCRSDNDRRDRDRDKSYNRPQTHDRDRQSREYRDAARDTEHDARDWDRTERDRVRDRDRDRDRSSYKHDNNYRRTYGRSDDREREDRKRPRTPPPMSPKRPRTPHDAAVAEVPDSQEIEPFVEEETTTEQPTLDVAAKSPIKERTPPATAAAAEEVAQIDVEEFEPILSDEDILDDNEHYQEMDYDYNACANSDDLIKLFVPGTTELTRYRAPRVFKVTETALEIEDNLKTAIVITDDYFNSSITEYSVCDFNRLNTEIKEEFIHLCEKLTGTIGSLDNFLNTVELYEELSATDLGKWSVEDRAVAGQITRIVETMIDWLKIALNYEMANIQDQPPYKIRHIKCGVRLAEWCCNSEIFVRYLWARNFVVHDALLNLYKQEFMALSIKLMVLKALDTYLTRKFSMDKFLSSEGYKTLLDEICKNPLVRIKFALNSILKKINLFEVFVKMRTILVQLRNDASTDNVSAEDINLTTKILGQILGYTQTGPFVLSQPKRFLPVASQFEIARDDTKNVLIEYFRMFDLLESFLLLLTYPSTLNLPAIKTPIFEVIEELLESVEGLEYLSDNCDTVNVLLKCLLQSDEEVQYAIQNCIEIRSHNLGLNVAYKLRAYFHVASLLDLGKKYNYDCGCIEIIDQLHALFCLSFNVIGKVALAEILGMKQNFKAIFQFLTFRDKSENQLTKIKKSPGVAYIVDLMYLVIVNVSNIPLLEKFSKDILHVINYLDIFEEPVLVKLNEIRTYVCPFETANASYDNVTPFVETIQKDIDDVTSFPGQLITSLRVLQHLATSRHSNKTPVLSENPLNNYVELKHKHVVLQLFSGDGTATMLKILQKLCEFYEQPSLYSSNFVSQHGLTTLNVIEPCVVLLKQMLTYVIQCRNTNFKDLTAIPILLQTYNVLTAYPHTSPHFQRAQRVCEHIIDTLLVYTQPVSEEIHETDSLNKTLWSMMCGEVIKYITSAPYTFISGLLIFSELLPLPLPIQTSDDLTSDESTWAINLRKLWAAHLHPHNNGIQELVVRLCTTTHQHLLNLLRRICVQLADLAANSAVMIVRGVVDSVHEAVAPKSDDKDVAKSGPCSGHLARLLNFLACLVTHNTLKCAFLHLMQANVDEKYASLIDTFAHILKTNSSTNHHVQAQECVLSIVQSLCDTEVTLYQNGNAEVTDVSSNSYLANALPVKELLVTFTGLIVDHLMTDSFFVTYLPVVRSLLLLTEHDYGFYYLRENLVKKPGLFVTLLDKLAGSFSKSNEECISILSTLVEFFRVSLIPEEVDESLLYLPRKMKLTLAELKSCIGWMQDKDHAEHPICTLENLLRKIVEGDNTFDSLLENVTGILKLLETEHSEIVKEQYVEPLLPSPESLLMQFTNRTVVSSADVCNERLTTGFWLAAPNVETDVEVENIPCDLMEVCRQNLPADFNLTREVEKLCRICPSDEISEKEKRLDDQKSKMKKPYITPIRTRGFPRTVQQRPDLFRSRPPNTSRPPSLHVDDFVALETCGAQPTGPTGYNKISRELLACSRNTRGTRGRAFVTSERAVQYRQMSWWGAGMGRGPY